LRVNKIFLVIIFLISLFSFGIIYVFNNMISLKGEKVVYIALNDSYNEAGAVVNFNNSDNDIKISSNVDNTKVGKYKIKYETEFFGIKFKNYRIVKVVDDEAPSIELKGESEVIVCPNSEYEEEGYSAYDNYDGDLTSKVVVKKKDNVISYSVVDNSSNSIIVNRKIEKKDVEIPEIKLKEGSTYNLLIGEEFIDPGYDVSDNCDKNIDVKVSGDVNVNKAGIYELLYTALDDSGNSVSIKRYVKVNEKVVNNTGVIYLTFDDGPSNGTTPKILDILDKKGIKATFFVVNHGASLDYLIKKEYDLGHSIGLHSYTHSYSKIYSSKDNYYDDLTLISNKVKNITGEDVKMIRFPGGGSNSVSKKYKKGIMSELTKEVIDKGYRYYDWNVESGDAGGAKTSEDVYNNVTSGLKNNRINIVLMHDFENNDKTIEALEDIIDYGLANGYRFDKIDMTTPMIRHRVNN